MSLLAVVWGLMILTWLLLGAVWWLLRKAKRR